MRLVHSSSPIEDFCFLFDGSEAPAEVSIWRENDLQTNALHLARAVRSVGSGWFLDIGGGRSAYLNNPPVYLKPDGTLCHDKLTQGDRLLVRIVRPETAEKEAEASYKVTLSGKNIVLMPMQKTPSFSKKLEPAAVERLKLLAPNEGVLFRTSSQNADLKEIADEIEALKIKWRELLSNVDSSDILYKPERDVFLYAEKYKDVLDEIVTDDARVSAELKERGYPVSFCLQGVWQKERLDEALDAARSIKTPLPSGGFLITEQTAACVCFDVNAGSGRIVSANEEACPEILRQIRLKGLGGQMIIDFAGRKDEKIIKRLIPGLKNKNVFISGMSTLGLVELTVEKTKRSLFDLYSAEQAVVRTAARIVRELWFQACESDVCIYAPVSVLSCLRPCLEKLEERLHVHVKLENSETVRVEGMKNESTQCF